MKTLCKYISFSLFILMPMMMTAQEELKWVQEGNQIYHAAMADTTGPDTLMLKDAEAKYRKALDAGPNLFEANYNLGNALFYRQEYEQAAKFFESQAVRSDISLEQKAKTYHNWGNSLLASGKLQEAIDAYKNALRINPNDKATKYNLAYALKQKKKQPPQQQQQQQNQDQNEQDQQEQQNQEDQQQQEQEQEQGGQDEEQENEQEQQAGEEKDEISKEDAERMLKAIEQDEQDTQEKVEKAKRPQPVRIEKDW